MQRLLFCLQTPACSVCIFEHATVFSLLYCVASSMYGVLQVVSSVHQVVSIVLQVASIVQQVVSIVLQVVGIVLQVASIVNCAGLRAVTSHLICGICWRSHSLHTHAPCLHSLCPFPIFTNL